MTSKTTRLYRVVTPTKTRLIESTNIQRAIAFAAKDEIKADIPAQFEVFAMAKAGIEIESVLDQPISDETRTAVAQEDLVGA